MELVVREADPSDTDRVSSLAIETYAAAFGHSISPDDLRHHVRQELSPAALSRAMGRDVFQLAEVSSQLVGFVQFGAAQSAESCGADAELRRLYVQSDFQNRGIGSRLMEVALSHSALSRASAIALDVWVENERAQRFYERYGFRPVGERPFKVASGAPTTPDLIMLREAGPA